VTTLRATYRLQLTPSFGFQEARALVPYLRELGVSHLYLSPSLQARRGSTHSYDVVDPSRVSEELGGEQALRRLAADGLGVILDIVPNHMGASEENRFWRDAALRARFFDIDPETGRHRRFFDIDDLAAVRQEDPEVFAATHAKVLELLADGVIDGVRVDHPDGLADPAGYLRRLRDAGAERVWVEKILHPPEALREWPVSGTVGYEFLVDVATLFVDPAGERELTALWQEISGDERSFAEVALEAQLEQARGTFSAEVGRLVRVDPRFDRGALEAALAKLPVYRTYVEPWSGRVERADREAIAAAEPPPELARALLLEDGAAPAELPTRFQQTSPAVTAKGIEDTAFYRWLRLLALNEVGNDPGRFSLSVEEFHAASRQRAARFPEGLLVTQTHDTKRSGDSRARIAALSTMAGEWAAHVREWRALNAPLREGGRAPDAVEEYLLYQTLVGVWPIEPERLDAYLQKALRESKRNTNWVQQDHAWERATQAFGRRVCASERFRASFEPFLERVVREGERSALGQLLLKLTVPGVPDIYQGDELWRLALVDPDNRRPVDFDARRAALARLREGAQPTRETIKLFLIARALELRARRPETFASGGYTPLAVEDGEVCAFLRGGDVAAVVPVRAWERSRIALPEGRWRDVLAGGTLELGGPTPVGGLVERHGVALLERE
jgi:(1->4)-alpha-D-glucan 1-alpha-D-glucosylmutase